MGLMSLNLATLTVRGLRDSSKVNVIPAQETHFICAADSRVLENDFAPNITVERVFFFRWLAPFLDDPKRLVLIGGWNVIFDPKIDKIGWGASSLGKCESRLIDFMARHDLSAREMWTWLDSSSPVRVGSYLNGVLEELTVISLVVPHST